MFKMQSEDLLIKVAPHFHIGSLKPYKVWAGNITTVTSDSKFYENKSKPQL